MLKITADNREDAIKEAIEELRAEGYSGLKPEDLIVNELVEDSGFLGLKKRKVFQVELKEKQEPASKIEEEELAELGEVDIDGHFAIRFREEGIMLRVFPPQNNGQKVSWLEVKKALEEREVKEYDLDLLRDTIEEASGEWVAIAPRKPELDRNAELSFQISSSGLEARVDYIPPLGGEHLTEKKIDQALRSSGIKYGLDKNRLYQLVGEEKPVKNLLIASGDAPTEGEDGYLEYHFERSAEGRAGVEREDGSIDYRTLDKIENVMPGDVLVTRIPPKFGEPGKKVTGEEIPPPRPNDVSLPRGKNVETEKNDLKSLIEGQVVEEAGRVNVYKTYTVYGDVDMETGNIDFIGNVQVNGSVQDGFTIKAEGDVEIKGGVGASRIESGGDIIVSKGFQGGQKGQLMARGDIMVKFAENANLRALGDVHVNRAIMHSDVQAGGDVIVKGKGLIVGGQVMAGNKIEAKVIGSSLATSTIIKVGVDPKLRDRVLSIEEKLENDHQSLEKAMKAIVLLLKKRKTEGSLSSDKKKLLMKMAATRDQLEARIEELEHERDLLTERLEHLQQGRISVQDTIYSGVELTIGSATTRISEKKSHLVFVNEDGDVATRSY